jgi:hypothetical protein
MRDLESKDKNEQRLIKRVLKLENLPDKVTKAIK